MVISPSEKLRRFLKLELNRNCDNRAVVGGMAKFQPNWQRESSGAGVDPALIEKVNNFLNSYESKSVEERKAAVEEIMAALPAEDAARPAPRPERPPRERHSAEEAARPAILPERNHREQHPAGNPVAEDQQKPQIHRDAVIPERHERKPRAERSELPSRSETTGQTERPERRMPQRREVSEAAVPVQQPAEPVAQNPSGYVRITHPKEEKSSGPTPAELRRRYGRGSVNPEGPSLESSVAVIPGIGEINAKALAKQGVYTVRDFLYYFPRRYDDYSQFKTINRLVPEEVVTVLGVVKSIENSQHGKYLVTECLIHDGTGTLRITWFNRQWLIRQIRVNQTIVVSGKIDVYLGRPVMSNPEWEPGDQEHLTTNRIVPIYALNQNLKQNFLRRMIFNTVRHWKQGLEEFLPDSILESADLLPLQTAISQIHFPDSHELLAHAKRRLAFDEVFLMQLNVLSQKQHWTTAVCDPITVDEELLVRGWINHLPFKLTDAQWVAVRDIQKDMQSGHPMNRLVQGDVGSGKTIVASIAALIASQGSGQAAIMAPTGVLAEQHYRNFLKFMEGIGDANLQFKPDQVEILTGGTGEAKKREIRERLANGEIKVIIGTHALIEDPVIFNDLRLAVIDEQHRFGVAQRAALRAKGNEPHILVMTATPIPRSLSLTIYGDLDLSVIWELPAGRQAIRTDVVQPYGRERVYNKIREEIKKGHQAFIIYPLVEEGDDEEKEGRAAIEASERLQQQIFPDFRVALLHGRMKPEEKDSILQAFKEHEYDILVSTSVIEVGVDIPNATVMVIEGANRFGLAQLHQFRGRVGRGNDQSYCILIPETSDASENQRIKAMTETSDGFKLAEMDLEMRGPGDFIGKRQSGVRDLKLASLGDVRLIDHARKEAEALFEKDPNLDAPEHAALKQIVSKMTVTEEKGEIS